MATTAPIIKKAYWTLAAAGACYFVFLGLLCFPDLQRHALYAYKINTNWWRGPDEPEHFGFLKSQVRPFYINTSDGERLYGWHVLPIRLYAEHEDALLREVDGQPELYESSLAFQLLSRDQNSRVVLSFHGNGGTVSQGWRPHGYRALSAGDPDRIHVLTIDYRGFGYSTGIPGEEGLILDGVAFADYVLSKANLSPNQIVIHGQSLGTAVSVAIAEHFSRVKSIDFRGMVLVAPFSNMPSLLLTYAIAGLIPILSPLRPYPSLQRWFSSTLVDTWLTDIRLSSLVKMSKHLDVRTIHARDDLHISWRNSEDLFYAAANATTEGGMEKRQIDAVKMQRRPGKNNVIDIWKAAQPDGNVKYIRNDILPSGGHNEVTTYAAVSKAILDIFERRT